jgi:hypothetical protein
MISISRRTKSALAGEVACVADDAQRTRVRRFNLKHR